VPVLTVDITAAAIERALRDGAQDFVAKPFNETEVLLSVQNLWRTGSCTPRRAAPSCSPGRVPPNDGD
jgi:FixJ family two-component response regulator